MSRPRPPVNPAAGPAAPTLALASLGLRVWTGLMGQMTRSHRHDDIEVNLLHTGKVEYLLGARRQILTPGSWYVFWAGLPHVTLSREAGTRVTWVTLPLSTLLQWQLPQPLVSRLLAGDLLADSSAPAFDAAQLARWETDLQTADPACAEVVLLELQARLRRLALSQPAKPSRRRSRPTAPPVGKLERLAGYIATHYREPVTVGEIAAAASLHPHYATTLFRQHFGVSLMTYVLRHRLAHAQRLLASSDRSILELALDAGFGSLTQFYVAFHRHAGCTPRQYRLRLRQ